VSGHNELKNYQRLAQVGPRGFGIDDNADGITRLGETLQGTVDLYERPELALLRGERLFARSISVPAVAARNGTAQLINPAGSGLLGLVYYAKANIGTLDFQIGAGGFVGANPVVAQGLPLDGRLGNGAVLSTFSLTSGDAAAGANTPQFRTDAAGTILTRSQGVWWVIPPGGQLGSFDSTVNEAFRLTIIWSERQLFVGEGLVSG